MGIPDDRSGPAAAKASPAPSPAASASPGAASPPDPGEARLLERARSGDRDAFAEIMETHLPRVWRVVWGVLRHREDTEDVVQEVFVAAHRALEGFRGDARLSTWLHRIAVNRALNYRDRVAERVRRASLSLAPAPDGSVDVPEPAAPETSASGSPLRHLELRELQARLARCMQKVPETWRAVLTLRESESLSYEQIADVVGIAIGTVRSRLSRARLALRKCIEEGAA